jgi:hypothetical protein
MMQWLVPVIILVLAFFLVPMSVRSTKRSRKGRLGGVMTSFADGLATALDPKKAMIVAEMEKRQNQDGEEADGDDEPLTETRT